MKLEFKDTTIIPAKQARLRFGEILDKSYYQGDQFLIVKKKIPMAIIVGVRIWEELQSSKKGQAAIPKFTSSNLGKMKLVLTREHMYE